MSSCPSEPRSVTDSMVVDGVTFTYAEAAGYSESSEHFYLCKPGPLVDEYMLLLSEVEDRDMLELGIWQGGSTALAALAGRPRKLVSIDKADPVPALDDFIRERDLGDRVRPKYGIDQSDQGALLSIAHAEFDGLDVVVDDASHLLAPTRSSFEALFPLVRPGGRYLIEDWHWEVRYAAEFRRLAREDPVLARRVIEPMHDVQHSLHALAAAALSSSDDPAVAAVLDGWDPSPVEYQPLVAIVGELAAVHAWRPDVVASVHVEGSWIVAERGPAELAAPCSLADLAGPGVSLL